MNADATPLVYKPASVRHRRLLAWMGGPIFTAAIFLVLPLSQQISSAKQAEPAAAHAVFVAPPVIPEIKKQEEIQDEPEPDDPPPELEEDPFDLDITFDLNIPMGTEPGGFPLDRGFRANLVQKMIKDEVLGADQLDERPRQLYQPQPRYPSAMRKQRLEGRVVLLLTLDEKGRVVHAKVSRSSQSGFNDAALAAARNWKFKPGMKGGKPVRSKILQPITFKLPR